MRLDYADHTNKTPLTISSVKLFIYAKKTLDAAAALGSCTFTYNIGAGEVTIVDRANPQADFDYSVTPFSLDITAAIGGDWAKLDALQTFVTHAYAALSATVTVSVDAIELEVVASATQAL